jgi:hypothetical protein
LTPFWLQNHSIARVLTTSRTQSTFTEVKPRRNRAG